MCFKVRGLILMVKIGLTKSGLFSRGSTIRHSSTVAKFCKHSMKSVPSITQYNIYGEGKIDITQYNKTYSSDLSSVYL